MTKQRPTTSVAPADRSIVFPVAAAVGGLVLACAWRAVSAAGRRREAAILLLSMLGWVLAQMFNSVAWQRYCEPIALIGLIWLAALAVAPNGDRESAAARRWWIGPLVLGIIQLSLTSYSVYYNVFEDLIAR